MTPAENSQKPRMLTGGCLCGAVTYEVADAFEYALNCHCEDCRRATGSAFKPFAGIQQTQLRLVSGADRILIFGPASAAHDVHCRSCGSLLYSVVGGGWVHVTLGTLKDEPAIRPTAHIFVADKAPWFQITDSLPRFPGHRT